MSQRPRSAELPDSGLLVIDKPAGWTSHQIVGRVRRLVGTRKVGHAGTLDPMATGVLLVGINRATRLLGHLMLTEKAYTGTIRLGISTVTDDAEGQITQAVGTAGIGQNDVLAEISQFIGDIVQVPAKVSAIKINGVRSYARVRAGEDVEHLARPVHISRFLVGDIRVADVDGCPVIDLTVDIECSSGTYIRALARDLGDSLGVGGHLTALRRTRVGPFGLDRATGLADTTDLFMITMAEVARTCFPVRVLDQMQATDVRHGRRLAGTVLADLTALLDESGQFLALYRPAGHDAVAEAVFAPAGTVPD